MVECVNISSLASLMPVEKPCFTCNYHLCEKLNKLKWTVSRDGFGLLMACMVRDKVVENAPFFEVGQ